MRKRAAPPPPSSSTSKKAPAPKPPPKRARKTATGTAGGDATPAAAAAARKKPTRLFPADPEATRRVLAFDIGIVNLAYAVVTLTGADDFAIESLAANNIMRDDPPGGPPTDDEVIAAAAAAGPRRRRRPGEAAPLPPPKAKGRGAKEPLKVLTERLTAYLWARADRLLGRRPHAVVIEQQSKKALRLSALGAVVHSFVLNYYLARAEQLPPVFMQSGRQKLRVVFRPLPSTPSSGSSGGGGGIAAWCAPSGAGSAPRLVTRFRVAPPLPTETPTTTVVKTVARRRSKVASEKANDDTKGAEAKAPAATTTGKQGTKVKPKSKAKQKRAEDSATWRVNKKRAVANFAPLLHHYPGCRRWAPLFERSKKKDDLADAALHAIFLLKAGGTRLARTKDLDDASLIVLPLRPDKDGGGDGDNEGNNEGNNNAPDVVEKKKSRRGRAAAAPTTPVHVGAPRGACPPADQNEDGGDDEIIDLVHYATDDSAHNVDTSEATDDDDLPDPSDFDDGEEQDDDDDDDDIQDDRDDDSVVDDESVHYMPRRLRRELVCKTTTTRPTAVPFSDSDQSDTDSEEEEEDNDDDDDWAADLGICPAPSGRASPVASRHG
ncbi:hypothetical protein psal_cds_319 [Pandoravirus salinus]|uniref:Uncharacterized protein n=1 Tax=Pandoravirus salinus TaxID=1349410 RepID=S4W1E3_9VIRU|nr:hypothetical protein psal_cds_319 [Pandoravirus salinus]AGO83940.1 hypothetical protein psal_cds_319 [Pandoravirus salinus]